jgi:hypothetical protein
MARAGKRPVTPLRLSRRLLSLPKRRDLTVEQIEALHTKVVAYHAREFCTVNGKVDASSVAEAEQTWRRNFGDDPDGRFAEIEAVALEWIAALIDLVAASRRPLAPGAAKVIEGAGALGFDYDKPLVGPHVDMRDRAEALISVVYTMGDVFGGVQ